MLLKTDKELTKKIVMASQLSKLKFFFYKLFVLNGMKW